ncbi:hypothetical protein N5D09_22460, partial [Stutzerimonas stutzeri]
RIGKRMSPAGHLLDIIDRHVSKADHSIIVSILAGTVNTGCRSATVVISGISAVEVICASGVTPEATRNNLP